MPCKYCLENTPEYFPPPLVGEGVGEGEHAIFTPTFILPHQGGGGSCRFHHPCIPAAEMTNS